MKQEYKDLFIKYDYNPFGQDEIEDGPLVSILMAYYNNAQYLEDALLSICEQRYQNWELIIIDDASPCLQAEEIIKSINDPRINYERLAKNNGAAKARTRAFKKSKGNYIACFDPDDIMSPTFISALMQRAIETDNADIVFMDLIAFGATEELIKTSMGTEKGLTVKNWLVGQSLMSRRVWEAIDGQSKADIIRFGSQDWEMWLHAFSIMDDIKVAHAPLPLFLYRQHSNTLCSKSNFYEYLIREHLVSEYAEIFAKHGTKNIFLMEGYAKSIRTFLISKKYREALKILGRALQALPFTEFIKKIARMISCRLK